MDGMFTQLFRPVLNKIYPCQIEEVRHNTQKEVRIINVLEPALNQHRIIISPDAIQYDYDSAMANYTAEEAPKRMMMYQLSRISKDRKSLKFDDRLDAFAMMVQSFKDMVALDQDTADRLLQQKLLDEEIEQFRREAGLPTGSYGLTMDKRMVSRIRSRNYK